LDILLAEGDFSMRFEFGDEISKVLSWFREDLLAAIR
jgi:hypothetical protein